MGESVANVIGDALIPMLLSSIACLLPFGLFQSYAFTHFCGLTKPSNFYDQEIIDYAHEFGLKMPSADKSEWCSYWIPIPYTYVQDHYWDVGFLRYFQLKQIPNFLLAAPVLFLVFKHAKRFFDSHRFYAMRLGCTYYSIDPAQKVPIFDPFRTHILPRECFVHVVHITALALFSFLCVHVQISTRMLFSSSPVLYWIAALITSSQERKSGGPGNLDLSKEDLALKLESKVNLENTFRNVVTDEPIVSTEAKWIKIYFVSYTLIGTVLFSNFLPWT